MTQPSLRPAAQVPKPAPDEGLPNNGRRTRWPWVVAGLLAVLVIGSAAYAMNAGDEPAAERSAATAQSEGAGADLSESGGDAITLNRTGADGVFVVTVTGVRCGVKTVGPAELPQRAEGEFCLVNVTAENAGSEAQLLDGGIQHAVDTRGRSYRVADAAAAFLNDQRPTLLEEIAAGATVRGVLPFDVPSGTRLAALLLHESPGSRGARVELTG